jgi:hypothetical protein
MSIYFSLSFESTYNFLFVGYVTMALVDRLKRILTMVYVVHVVFFGIPDDGKSPEKFCKKTIPLVLRLYIVGW